MMSLIVRFGGVVGDAAADGVGAAAALADFAGLDCVTLEAASVVTAVVEERVESVAAEGATDDAAEGATDDAAEGATDDLGVRAAPGADFGLARSADPASAVCFGGLARPVLPTAERLPLWADGVESPRAESACATPVAVDSAAQTPTARVPAPNQIETLLDAW
ncbi:hypothetical protein [Mycobacterium sp. ENV421]|uniref:hypothetical protein n=1 Tax=Mycobacterium sp. ENV421 TaxID=1213407 RepID=UPI001304F5B6|nr:hypothetical protein [Mycobacterium sp. ENV421]